MSQMLRLSDKKREAKRKNPIDRIKKSDLFRTANASADPIMFLQRTIGNKAIGSLFKDVVGPARFKIGRSADIYEWEADRAADQAMLMSTADIQPKPT